MQSRRSKDMFIHSEARLQDEKNRQKFIEVEDKKLQIDYYMHRCVLHIFQAESVQLKWVFKEQARKLLPEGIT